MTLKHTAIVAIALTALSVDASPVLRTVSMKQSDPSESMIYCRDFGETFRKYHTLSARPLSTDDLEAEPLSEAPGVARQFTESGGSYLVYWGNVFDYEDGGLAAEMNFDDDAVYLRNPCSMILSNTYIKGRLDAEGVTFTLPQVLMYNGSEKVYIQRMKRMSSDVGDTYVVDEDTQEVRFTYDGDNLVMEGNGDESSIIMGLTDADGAWYGYGDHDIVLEPFNDSPLTRAQLPDDAIGSISDWALIHSAGGHMVEVAREGNDIYVGGLLTATPDVFIKATASAYGGTLNSGQYIGVDALSIHRLYFYAATALEGENAYGEAATVYRPLGEASLSVGLDAIESADSWTLGTFLPGGEYLVNEAFDVPRLVRQPREISMVPAPPSVVQYVPYEAGCGYGMIDFYATQLNEDGYLIADTDYLFWQLMVDDEPYQFMPGEYELVPDKMTNVPFAYADFQDFFIEGQRRILYFYVPDYERIGVRMVYKRGGETFESTTAYAPEPVDALPSEDSVGVGAEVVGVETYDMTGRRVADNAGGIVVRRNRLSDGSVTSTLLRN